MILYKTVKLKYSTTLSLLAHTVRTSTSPVASWLRDVKVELFALMEGDVHGEDLCDKDLLAILLRAVNLGALSLPHSHRPVAMEVASLISRPSLQKLDITLDQRSSPSLLLVGALTNLRSLTIHMPDECVLPSNCPGWQLSLLTTLVVKLESVSDQGPPFAAFLCTCQFDNLKKLFYKVEEPSDRDVDAFAIFLQSSHSLQTLRVNTAADQVIKAIPASVKNLTLRTLDRAAILFMPSTVKELVLVDVPYFDLDNLWDALYFALQTKTGLCQIQISSVYPAFLWVDGDPQRKCVSQGMWDYEDTGRLLAYAGQLASQGIRLVDEAGKTVRDCIPI
jgi:hypothetical protein